MRKKWRAALVIGCIAIIPGCRNCCPAPPPPNDVAAAYPPRPLLGYTLPHRLTPMEAAPIGASPFVPVPSPPLSAPPGPPSGVNGAGLAVPQSPPPQAAQPDARLLPPESSRGGTSEPVRPAGTDERQPAAVPERPLSSLPVGIPQFAGVKDQVSAGLKPMLDGLDWLKSAGYRTVLHVRAPSTDDNADRREVERRGFKYVSIELSPQTLSAATIEQFNRIIGDSAAHPLFVYDRDGTLAGGLWYLYYRTVDRTSDETARTQAGRLGLKDAATDEQRAMWLAIQKYLSSQAR